MVKFKLERLLEEAVEVREIDRLVTERTEPRSKPLPVALTVVALSIVITVWIVVVDQKLELP